MSDPKRQLTSADIRKGLARRFAAPAWAIFFEVANGTGVGRYRYADALAMSLFPSRGLELHGFEIKISRNDWRREAKDPAKAEAIAAYCDRWWVVVPRGLDIPRDAFPPAWGLMSFDGRAFKTEIKAEKIAARPLDRVFLAALIRRAHEGVEALARAKVENQVAEQAERFDASVQRAVEARTRKHADLAERVEKFEKASGLSIDSWNVGEIGAAVKIVRELGVESIYGAARRIPGQLRDVAGRLDEIMQGVPIAREAAE